MAATSIVSLRMFPLLGIAERIVGYFAQHIIQNCQINSGTAWKVPSKIAHSELAVAVLPVRNRVGEDDRF